VITIENANSSAIDRTEAFRAAAKRRATTADWGDADG
jgi:hypothetical protein